MVFKVFGKVEKEGIVGGGGGMREGGEVVEWVGCRSGRGEVVFLLRRGER